MSEILEGTVHRIACNQSSRTPVLEYLSGQQVKFWKGSGARIQCTLFNDSPEAASLITDLSNIASVSFFLRKRNSTGVVLLTKTLTATEMNSAVTWAEWLAATDQHFEIELADTDTNIEVPPSGHLPIYFVIRVNTANQDTIAAFGYGSLVDVGATNILPPTLVPAPPTFDALYVDAEGNVQNPTANFASGSLKIGARDIEIARDKGGAVFNVRAYGAVGNGVTNDYNAFVAALAVAVDGGTVYVPPGVYRLSQGIDVKGNISLIGAGLHSTHLVVDLDAAYGIKWGVGLVGQSASGKLEGFRVHRAAGTILTGTIGIAIEQVYHGDIVDVMVSSHDLGIRTSTYPSVGLTIKGGIFANCKVHLWLKDATEVVVNDCTFGVSLGEVIAANQFVIFDGATGKVKINSSQFYPRLANSTVAFKWINIPVDNFGNYRFVNIDVEGVDVFMQSDVTTLIINDFALVASKVDANKMFDFNAVTLLAAWAITSNAHLRSVTPVTLLNTKDMKVIGNRFDGSFTFTDGRWIIVGNAFVSASNYTGVFSALILVGNIGMFSGSVFNVTGSGPIYKTANAVVGAVSPTSNFPGVTTFESLFVPPWITPTYLNGYTDYGLGIQVGGYTKDPMGWVHLKGLIRRPTSTPLGTTILVLPAGYRPTAAEFFAVVSAGIYGQIRINPDGTILFEVGGSNISLSGISFRTT